MPELTRSITMLQATNCGGKRRAKGEVIKDASIRDANFLIATKKAKLTKDVTPEDINALEDADEKTVPTPPAPPSGGLTSRNGPK